MAKSRYNTIEEKLRTGHASYLRALERMWGINIKCFKLKQDAHTAVYGINSGEEIESGVDFVGIVAGDDFFPSSAALGGWFQQGWLYTSSDVPRVGDTIQLDSSDGRSRRFKIESKESIGTTTGVFGRLRLAALAD